MNELENFKKLFIDKLEEMERTSGDLKDLTPWDIIVSVLSNKDNIGIVTLKADIAIIKKLAEGFSAYSIGLMLGVPTKNIMQIADIWGLVPMAGTLDFSPLFVYKDGMTPDELMGEINVVLSIPVSKKTAQDIIHNVERYYELIDILKEEEQEDE